MSDYTVTATWATKDALASGTTLKAISATELGTEFDNIATASATKYDSADRDAANGLCPLDASSLVPVGNLPAATTTAVGVLEIATDAEAQTGTATDKWLTPANLAAVTGLNAGIVTDLINLTDPGADRILFWDDSAGTTTFLTVGTGLSITTTTLATNDSAIVHDNLSGAVADEHIAHSGVAVTAATGLAVSNADIAASFEYSLDIPSLTNISGTLVAATDEFLVYDASASAHKVIAYQSGGIPIITKTADYTLTDADMNSYIQGSHATVAITFTLGTGVGEKGNVIIIEQSLAAQVDVLASSVTINKAVGLKTRTTSSVITLVCTATDVWTLYGDATA